MGEKQLPTSVAALYNIDSGYPLSVVVVDTPTTRPGEIWLAMPFTNLEKRDTTTIGAL
jgi:hypothetical protein